MNEPGGDRITDFLNEDLRRTHSNNLDGASDERSDGIDEVDGEGDPDSDEELSAGTRGGLPPTFRMRHDAHYVDELMSRAVDPAPDRVETARLTPVAAAPPLPAPPLGLIADRLESIAGHTAIIRAQPAVPSFIADSVQIEFARVTRLARAAAILQDHPVPMRSDVATRDMVDGAIRAGAPVARLAGIEFDASADDPAFAILAEPAMVIQGIAGTVDAVVDLLLADPRRRPTLDGRMPSARISISLQTVRVRPAIILDVVCPTLHVAGDWGDRFFDNAADDYRAAPAAGVLLAAAAAIVRAHGGRADLKRHNGTGATITYVFPQTA